MSSIYIHIPFCKQACTYCDFHFSVHSKYRARFINALCREIALRKDYLDSPIETLYFGGGTPSLLTPFQLELIFEAIQRYFTLESDAEITLEANPDDLSLAHLKFFKTFGINRLSIGVQSFEDRILRFFNRSHKAEEARRALFFARETGFENLNVDLMFGFQGFDWRPLEHELQNLIELGIPHFSMYGLTVEPKTALAYQVRRGSFSEIEDALFIRQYEALETFLKHAGYVHYEISNYALPGAYARHNCRYWQQKPYLGLGPSAHSYNGNSRQVNVPNNLKYITALEHNSLEAELMILTPEAKINEYLLTGLRTQWGCDNATLKTVYQYNIFENQADTLEHLVQNDWIQIRGEQFTLTAKGRLLADSITAELLV